MSKFMQTQMNNGPEFRDYLSRVLGNANQEVEKNKLELVRDKARHEALVFIGQQRLTLDELPYHTLKEVRDDYDTVTFITQGGRYVHMEVSPGYDGCVDFDKAAQLDIEDAYTYGILPKELYDAVHGANKALQESQHDQAKEAKFQGAVDFLEELGYKVEKKDQ
jgi:hypothetical protein